MHKNILIALFLIIIALSLSLPFFSYSKPALEMEVVFENTAYSINTIGLKSLSSQYYWDQSTYAHPPLYVLILALFCKIFGFSFVSLRLVGFFAISIMAVLVYFLSREIFKEQEDKLLLGIFASSLYLSIPLIIQSAVFIEIDNAILPITMMIFVFSYIHFYREQYINAKKIIILGCLFALSLWAKITTSLVLVMAVGIFYLLRRDFKAAVKNPLLIFLIGGTIFLVTFSIFCGFINWKCFRAVPLVFSVALIKKPTGAFYFQLLVMLKIILRLSLWMSPYFILLWLISLKDSFKRMHRGSAIVPLDFLSIYSCSIFIVYLFLGGTHVFPRYFLPMVFAICILAAGQLKEILKEIKNKDVIVFVAITILLIGYYVFIVKDMLYLTNYKLKVALALGGLNKKILASVIIRQGILYFLPFPLVGLLIRCIKKEFGLYQTILAVLFILAFSSNIGLSILQAKAKYTTAEQYGAEGQKEVIDFLNKHLSKDAKIIAPLSINYYLGKRDFPMDPYVELGYKYDPDKLLAGLKDHEVKALAYSDTQFTIPQIKQTFNDKSVQDFLAENFVGYNLKTYRIWLRRK